MIVHNDTVFLEDKFSRKFKSRKVFTDLGMTKRNDQIKERYIKLKREIIVIFNSERLKVFVSYNTDLREFGTAIWVKITE